MSLNNTLFNMDGANAFKVMQGETFIVPDNTSSPSPAGAYLNPSTVFDAKRQAVGGMIYAAFSDAAGPTSLDIQQKINPGDIIAISVIGGGKCTVTITNPGPTGNTVASFSFTITATAIAGVLGIWG